LTEAERARFSAAMSRAPKSDPDFEIAFYESVLARDPSYPDVIELLGGLYTKQGRIADGLRMDRKLVRLQPDNATAHYNLACSLALSKRKRDALRSLRQAVELGYRDFDWMSQDPDLEDLKSHPEFDALLAQLKPQS
jgi:tetratricopeptide (TPR) repeat protein